MSIPNNILCICDVLVADIGTVIAFQNMHF